jgi:hypothetical protein
MLYHSTMVHGIPSARQGTPRSCAYPPKKSKESYLVFEIETARHACHCAVERAVTGLDHMRKTKVPSFKSDSTIPRTGVLLPKKMGEVYG